MPEITLMIEMRPRPIERQDRKHASTTPKGRNRERKNNNPIRRDSWQISGRTGRTDGRTGHRVTPQDLTIKLLRD